jgi:hypothetical protein
VGGLSGRRPEHFATHDVDWPVTLVTACGVALRLTPEADDPIGLGGYLDAGGSIVWVTRRRLNVTCAACIRSPAFDRGANGR